MMEQREKYGGIYFAYMLGQPVLVVNDTEILKDILYLNYTQFTKSMLKNFFGPLFGTHNLLVIEGDQWKTQRKIIAPAFRNSTVQQQLPKIQEVCQQRIDKYFKSFKNGTSVINMSHEAPEYALDVITALAFYSLESGEEIRAAFADGVKCLMKFVVLRLIPFGRLLPDSITGLNHIKNSTAIFEKWIAKVIEKTKSEESNPSSFVNLLVSVSDEDTGVKLSYEEIIDNIKIFYFAGHETTAILLSYVFYFIIKFPDVFKKMQQEVDSVIGNSKEITSEHIEKLIYIQCVVKETLRLKTPVTAIRRLTETEVRAGKYIIPPKVGIVVPLDTLHRDKSYWENADEFIPERWYKLDDTKVRSDGYYMPFGGGPRICIGQRLAREEAIVFLVMMVKNFNCKAADAVIKVELDTKNFTFRPKFVNVELKNRV